MKGIKALCTMVSARTLVFFIFKSAVLAYEFFVYDYEILHFLIGFLCFLML